MWEVIEFGDSYKVPTTDPNGTTTTGGDAGTKSGRTVTITTEGMQRKKNNVKARTTLLLSLPDEHQLRFSKVATISQDTVSAYIASQSSGSQIKFEDINQIDEDDMEEMDIKWSVALLSMRADKFWKKIGKKISIQGLDVAGFEKSKVECFNCHKMGHFARECRAPRSQERGRKDNYRQGYKAEEKTPKALVAIDRVEWDWSYMVNEGEDHALVPDEEAPTEFVLMANTESKDGVDGKLVGLLKASKNLDNLIESQRSDKNKDRVGYSVVPPPITDLYLSPKKDLSWIGLPEFADDTVTDYSRPSPNVESTLEEGQNKNSSTTEDVATKPFVKFVKPKDGQSESKPNKKETPKKPPVKYAEQYRKSNKKPNVRGNQRNWNNLKSYQLGPEFVLKKKACFNCGDFTHLANDCKKRAHSYETRPFLKKTAVKTQYRASWVPTVNMNKPPVNRKFSTSRKNFPTANRKFPTASRKFPTDSTKIHIAAMGRKGKAGSSQNNIDDKGYWDSGCSRHMTSNISYLSDFEPFDGGYVSFGQGGCKITGKGTIKTSKLEFENVYFVKDLKYNLFSVSQICDNKNSIMFTNSKCIVLGRDFKLLDDVNILLRTPRQHNMYSIDLKNIVPHRDLTCLVAKASANECTLWHRRLDLFGPTSVNSISHKWYCLVVTDDFSRFTWTFFLRTKDETSGILKKFITKIENLKDLKVKIIREFSNARTLQQNGVAEKRNRTLIEAARTMLADAKLPVTFWAEAVNTDCYVQNRVPVDVGTNSTNLQVQRMQQIKNKPQDRCSPKVPEGSRNTNPTAFTSNPPADQMETLTVETFIPTVSSLVLTACLNDSLEPSSDATLISKKVANQEETPSSDNILSLTNQFKDILGVESSPDEAIRVEADVNNMETTITASPTPTLRIHKDHPKSQIFGPVDTPIQTKHKSKEVEEQSFIATIHQMTDPALLQFCLFSCFLSQVEPKKVSDALQDPSWVEAMQEELFQFKIQNVWTLVDYPKGVRPIETKWVLKNKKDERGIVIRNKARLVAQGHTQEEGIKYDEVFTHVARKEAIRLFLAYASFRGFTVYQMDLKSAFLYGTIDKEVYVMKPLGFQDLEFPAKVYIVEKAMYGLHQAPRAWYGDILKKFGYTYVRSSNTPMDKENPWRKDGTRNDVDSHLYRSMIGSLMYLTASRPDIIFAVCACACARHQVTPKECHLHAVKRIFRYLKGHPKLGLWYPKESPFDLVAYLDSDYGGATQDRKSTTRGNQLLDYGYNFMNTKIYIDNNNAICIVKNPVYHSKTKHIEIRHHFIRDCFEKKLISVDHIHTDENVADFLTKPFDAGRFQYLVGEYNTDFHPIVDFIAASPLRYALTVKPTVFVSHIRQFWSTARIKTTDEGTQILATVDGIQKTVSESSLRRNLKLRDEDGINSLPDTELFENLTLIGYNISQNQKYTFQKGQFSHQWKYLIHTIMQCLSPKSTGFNEFSSNIATALFCLATNRTCNFSKMIFDGMVKNVHNKVSKFLMYPRFLTICLRMSQLGQITHTHQYVVPFHTKKLFTTLRVNNFSFSGRIVPLLDTMLVHQGEGSGTPTEPHHTPSPEADPSYHTTSSMPPPSIPTAPIPPVTQPDTTLIRQYTRIVRNAQSSALLTIADEPASLVRDVSEGEACPTKSGFIADQDRTTIAKSYTLPHDSAPMVTSSAADKGSSGGRNSKVEGQGESDAVPTACLIVTTATVVTPYSRRKGKEVVVEFDTPKKQRLQEQINAQVARELEEQQEREDKKMTEQIARDAEVVRIHAEEDLRGMINSLHRTNETIAKYMQEYQDFALDLPLERRIEMISDLVKDFIPMGSKEEAERLKRKGFNLEQEKAKKQKTSEEVPNKEVS
uniref:CCHC-type domain-containing protein n=1 Tax=Tanacetum cinerariifolium TaxID=118510 RepID=A0A6L2L7E9_TANCI|nr:hypothetical protein [Tanacetum cinerariifolium]